MASKKYSLEQAAERFDGSQDFTIGIEEEFQILDPCSHELTSRFEELQQLASRRIGDFARGELIGSEIEICTDRCLTLVDAEKDLRGKRQALYDAAEELGVVIAASGTHPFSSWQDQRIIDTAHYRIIEEQLRYCAWRNVTFGMHTHVGLNGHQRVIAIFNAMRGYLPSLLAVSANSPFAEGRYTYLHSTRSLLFTKLFPRCNIPAPFRDWQEYAGLVESLFETNSISEPTQIWWSVRPHSKFGTLEIRICDCQTPLRDTLAISALTVALVARLCMDYDEGRVLPVASANKIEENMWRAMRYGLAGSLVDFDRRREVPATDAIRELLEFTGPVHSRLGLEPYLARLETILAEGNGAQRQIAMFERNADIKRTFDEVVRWSQPDIALA